MVAGVSYKGRQEACADCDEGDEVVLEREPRNPHDSNAILVLHNGDELGYVPREEAEFYAELMDEGAKQSFAIKKCLETSSGRIIPVVWGSFYRADADVPTAATAPSAASPRFTSFETSSAVSAVLATPQPKTTSSKLPPHFKPSALRGLLWVFVLVVVVFWLFAFLMKTLA